MHEPNYIVEGGGRYVFCDATDGYCTAHPSKTTEELLEENDALRERVKHTIVVIDSILGDYENRTKSSLTALKEWNFSVYVEMLEKARERLKE